MIFDLLSKILKLNLHNMTSNKVTYEDSYAKIRPGRVLDQLNTAKAKTFQTHIFHAFSPLSNTVGDCC